MKKYNLLWIVNLLIASLLVNSAGCSRKQPETGITLRFENWEVTPEQLKLWQEVTDKFNGRQTNIRVNFEGVQGGFQKILIEMAGGSAPDIFYWCAPTILAPLVEKGAVMDIASFIDTSREINPKDYFPFTWQAVRFGKGIYGLPTSWGWAAIAYNKDIFDQARLPYPKEDWTWEDFLTLAQKLTIREEDRTIQYGCTPLHAEWLVGSFGGSLFDEKGDCTIDNPQVKESLQYLWDLRYKYKVAPTVDVFGSSSYDYREETKFFMTGKVAMCPAVSPFLPMFRMIKNFDWDVAPLPKKQGVKRLMEESSGVLCISSQSKYPKEAFEFVKFACGEEGQAILGKGGNCIPSLIKVADSSFIPPPENIKVFIKQIEGISPCPGKFVWFQEWLDTIWYQEIAKVDLNQATVEDVVANLVKKTKKFLEERKKERVSSK